MIKFTLRDDDGQGTFDELGNVTFDISKEYPTLYSQPKPQTVTQTKPVWYSAKKGKKPKQQGTLTFKITGEAQKCVFEFESRFLKVFCVQTSQTIG